MRRTSTAAVLAGMLLAAACRHAAPPAPAPLPADWRSLVAEPTAFAALYRLSCCGQRGLPATIRGDGAHVSIAVAVPPGGVAFEAWVAADGGWIRDRKEGCTVSIPAAVLPLGDGIDVPVDPAWAALLLSGRLPRGSVPVAGAEGWVEGRSGRGWYRARVSGDPPRVAEVRLGELGRHGPALTVLVTTATSRLPRRLDIVSGDERAELELVEWHPMAEGPGRPGWVDRLPECGATR